MDDKAVKRIKKAASAAADVIDEITNDSFELLFAVEILRDSVWRAQYAADNEGEKRGS